MVPTQLTVLLAVTPGGALATLYRCLAATWQLVGIWHLLCTLTTPPRLVMSRMHCRRHLYCRPR